MQFACTFVFLVISSMLFTSFELAVFLVFPPEFFPSKGFFMLVFSMGDVGYLPKCPFRAMPPAQVVSMLLPLFCYFEKSQWRALQATPLVVTSRKIDGVHSRPHRIDINACIEGGLKHAKGMFREV